MRMSIPRTEANYRSGVNMRMIFIIAVVATMCYPALIDTATVRLEKLGEHLQNIILHGPGNTRIVRATEGSDEDVPKRNCYNTACGWAVYHPHTRSVEYFMKNACQCPDKSYKCVRSGDDLSASAYVYRCRQNTTADDIESPEDAN